MGGVTGQYNKLNNEKFTGFHSCCKIGSSDDPDMTDT